MVNGKITIEDFFDVPDKNTKLDEMGADIYKLCNIFSQHSNKFDKKKALDAVKCYTDKHDRLLYANISNYIFDIYSTDKMGIFETNLDSLSSYVFSEDFIALLKSANGKEKQLLIKTEKIIIKIYDHVNLAKRQLNVLKTTDDELKKYLTPFKQELTKEMSSQLITLVGIFTAMAFLVFGGISSLNNVFGKIETIPILKLMIMCCLWGLGILNLVFVFMFCIGRMTGLGFKTASNKIVLWSNFLLISIFIFSILFYYLDKNGMTKWFDSWSNLNAAAVSIISILILFVGCIVFMLYFCNKNKE